MFLHCRIGLNPDAYYAAVSKDIGYWIFFAVLVMLIIDGSPFVLSPLRDAQPLTAAQSELYQLLAGAGACAFEELELSHRLELRSPLALRSRLRYLKAKGYLLPLVFVQCFCSADPDCRICGGHGVYARFGVKEQHELSQTFTGLDRASKATL